MIRRMIGVGEVKDVRCDGKVSQLIIGVEGFLATGEADVALPFDAAKHSAPKTAPGLKYDRDTAWWVPAASNATLPQGCLAPPISLSTGREFEGPPLRQLTLRRPKWLGAETSIATINVPAR
jgi:hypothetical protein